MCRLTLPRSLVDASSLYADPPALYRQHSKASQPAESSDSSSVIEDGFDVFDEVCFSPFEPSAEGADGLLLPPSSPIRPPQGPTAAPAGPQQHTAVQRCLFSSSAQHAFSTLPPLIVPAAPFSSLCWGAPMQLPTPRAAEGDRRFASPITNPQEQDPWAQQRSSEEAAEQQSVQQWLAAMELSMPGCRSGWGPASTSTSTSTSPSPTAAGSSSGKTGATGALGAGLQSLPGGDLPPPAFALLGLLP